MSFFGLLPLGVSTPWQCLLRADAVGARCLAARRGEDFGGDSLLQRASHDAGQCRLIYSSTGIGTSRCGARSEHRLRWPYEVMSGVPILEPWTQFGAILGNDHLDPWRKTLRWAPATFLSKTPPFGLMAGVQVFVTHPRVLGLFLMVLGLPSLRGPCLCRKPLFLFNNSGQ